AVWRRVAPLRIRGPARELYNLVLERDRALTVGAVVEALAPAAARSDQHPVATVTVVADRQLITVCGCWRRTRRRPAGRHRATDRNLFDRTRPAYRREPGVLSRPNRDVGASSRSGGNGQPGACAGCDHCRPDRDFRLETGGPVVGRRHVLGVDVAGAIGDRLDHSSIGVGVDPHAHHHPVICGDRIGQAHADAAGPRAAPAAGIHQRSLYIGGADIDRPTLILITTRAHCQLIAARIHVAEAVIAAGVARGAAPAV